MSLFEDAMSIAVQLPVAERRRLAQALGVAVSDSNAGATPGSASGSSLPLHQFSARSDAAAWRKAERGHAVLAADAIGAGGATNTPPGAAAIAGMGSGRAAEVGAIGSGAAEATRLSQLPAGSPVVVHTDVCVALALGEEVATAFFQKPPVEIRLATATYLALLGMAESVDQQRQIRNFVQPYAVLSLGPMASSRAVELMLDYSQSTGMAPLDALIAATALAHEIPLVAHTPQLFAGVPGLAVCTPSN
jgi:predicted nucleic acid-binding protein